MKLALIAITAVMLWGWYSTDKKLDKLNMERKISHCQVVLFEDYSSKLESPKRMRTCINKLGYRLEWK